MARAKTSEQSRLRTKSATIEELARGVANLQEFLAQVEDLSREGFPYLDAGRARTELQFRECIRRTFGEKSSEFQEHRHHKLLMGSPEETQQSIALIKNLIARLEQKKRDLHGGPPLAQASSTVPTSPIPTRPQMILVPPAIPTLQMTMMQTAPITPPPVLMSVAMTTNLDLASAVATPTQPQSNQAGTATSREPEPPSLSSSLPEPLPILAAAPATSDTPPQPVARLVPVSTNRRPQAPQTEQAVASQTINTPQLLRREQESIMHSFPSARTEHQTQEPVSIPPPHMQPRPSFPIDPSSYQEPVLQFPKAGSDPAELVKMLCSRFHSVARQLRLRGEYRATLSVEDEFDAQDLLHALLRIQFDNVDTDEWTPSYSSGTPRTTLLLNDGRLAVIVKKTRTGLNAKDLSDQLQIDAERYRSHGRCTTLLCFMYDPEGRIGNPRGLEASLASVSKSFVIDVLVAPK
jgi:REase_DpnII-MboI